MGVEPSAPWSSLEGWEDKKKPRQASRKEFLAKIPSSPALGQWEPFPVSCPSLPCPQSLCSSPGAPSGPRSHNEVTPKPFLQGEQSWLRHRNYRENLLQTCRTSQGSVTLYHTGISDPVSHCDQWSCITLGSEILYHYGIRYPISLWDQ